MLDILRHRSTSVDNVSCMCDYNHSNQLVYHMSKKCDICILIITWNNVNQISKFFVVYIQNAFFIHNQTPDD